MNILEVINLTKYFGGLAAVKNVSFNIQEKEILGLIGPNGAGKTTIFNLISGYYKPTSGIIKFKSEDITGLKPHQICRRGISRTFQIVKPFRNMTVFENVVISAIFGKGNKTRDINYLESKVMDIIDFVGLTNKKDVYARNLTLHEQKLLELARALATNPHLLLLDEIMAGLNPVEIKEVIKKLREIRDMGVTIFVIEHVMKAIMEISDKVIVLHHGEKIAEGTPKEVSRNKDVIDAYLGEKHIA